MNSKKTSPHAIFHTWKVLCVGVIISNVSKTIFVVSIKKAITTKNKKLRPML
jgi:hypothetical protein